MSPSLVCAIRTFLSLIAARRVPAPRKSCWFSGLNKRPFSVRRVTVSSFDIRLEGVATTPCSGHAVTIRCVTHLGKDDKNETRGPLCCYICHSKKWQRSRVLAFLQNVNTYRPATSLTAARRTTRFGFLPAAPRPSCLAQTSSGFSLVLVVDDEAR